MQRLRRANLLSVLVTLALLLAVPVLAQTTGLSIPWFSVDGGGGTSTGGDLTLAGTIGQPDAGTLTGGNLTLTGGFWGVVGAVGTSTLTPTAGSVPVDVTTTFTLTWRHPQRWRDLQHLELRLRDERGIVLWARFSEGLTSTFSLLDAEGQVVDTGSAGEKRVLETATARLHLRETDFIGSGTDGPDVTVRFTVSFKQPAAGRVYITELIAREDSGNTQGPDVAGTWGVSPFPVYLPLIAAEP